MIQWTLQRQTGMLKEFFKGSHTQAHPLRHPFFLDELVQSSRRQLRDALLMLDARPMQLHPQALDLLRLLLHGSCHSVYVR